MPTLISSTFYFRNLKSTVQNILSKKNTIKHRSWRTNPLLLHHYTSDNTFFITLLKIQLLLFLASIHIPIWARKKHKSQTNHKHSSPKQKQKEKTINKRLKCIFREKQHSSFFRIPCFSLPFPATKTDPQTFKINFPPHFRSASSTFNSHTIRKQRF